MKVNANCHQCLFDKWMKRAALIPDPQQRKQFILGMRDLLDNRKDTDSGPYLVYRMGKLFAAHGGPDNSYAAIKQEYNRLVLAMEQELEAEIRKAPDTLMASMLFSRTGNYIDFSALKQVDSNRFLELLKEQSSQSLPEQLYQRFLAECENASVFLLLCDNCGEIVLDKLMLRQLRLRFPRLQIYAMVRGAEAMNDATMEDASCVGLTEEFPVLTNGFGIAGTIPEMLPDDARAVFDKADVILSKGQGNYESLSDCGRNIYYSFLCKCDLFTSRFQVPPLTGLFVPEIP